MLCAERGVRGVVERAGADADRDHVMIASAAQLAMAVTECDPCAVVIDREHQDADVALGQLALRPAISTILIVRDPLEDPPAGAQLVVFESSLQHALALAVRPREPAPPSPPRLDLLMAVSLLAGPLDEALENAAHQLAIAFGVERCVISVRGDGGGGRTANPRIWNHLDHCRMAAAASATVLAVVDGLEPRCESYLAVALETAPGSQGLVGLVAATARRFADEDRAALQAVATRLAVELRWRGVHDSAADELSRLASGPGLDPLVGIWNRVATMQLLAGMASAAVRSNRPLTVLVIDVVELRNINMRHGLKIGDLMLMRLADAVRARVRLDDLVGRWSGDKTVVILQDVTFDGAQEVARQLHATLATRTIELASGQRLVIPVTVGIATLQPNEDPNHMVARAAIAANLAPGEGLAVAAAPAEVSPPVALQLEVTDEPPVTLAGTYRLRHEISRGAMGVIYRADDLALERPVAIKMLRPDLAEDREFIKRLRAEAALLARIQHPNLVQIYNFGQLGGDSYFVMELVEGEALQEAIARHLNEGTTPAIAVNVAIIEEVASALDALHASGIIHRDVKPGNVIRDPFRSRGVLVDVGIAHRTGQLAEAAGTPGFIAPEVYAGEPATARSDVYGLAATAYATLTLVEPFGDGSALQILARQTLDVPPALPSSHVPELAPADAILLAGLHRDPARRPASAGEFSRALSAALAVAPAARSVRRAADDPRTTRVGEPAMQSQMQPQTRGVVFRSVMRVLGVHATARLRDLIGDGDPELARALIDTAPLAWLPTALLSRLLELAPLHLDWDGHQLARDVARATVRASFRRFFPSSAATLMPERSLSAIRNVWGRYHSWGEIMSGMASSAGPAGVSVVRLTGTPRNPELCAWTSGMLEQVVVLSGGRDPLVTHDTCEALGADACEFQVRWTAAQ